MIYAPAFLKPCSKCGQWLPGTTRYFGTHKRGKMGLQSVCRCCQRQQQREWRFNNPEKAHEADKRHHAEHREKRNAQHKKWYAKNRERAIQATKDWYAVNRDYRLAKEKKWRKDNPDLASQRDHKYHVAYAPKRRAYTRQYREKHPERVKAWSKNRSKLFVVRYRARKRSLPDTFTDTDWQRALEYFGNCCAVCGRPVGLWHTLAADHWIPLKSPDCPGTIPENIVPLCHGTDGCNNEKQARDPVEWLTEKLGKRKARRKLAEIAAYFAWLKGQK